MDSAPAVSEENRAGSLVDLCRSILLAPYAQRAIDKQIHICAKAAGVPVDQISDEDAVFHRVEEPDMKTITIVIPAEAAEDVASALEVGAEGAADKISETHHEQILKLALEIRQLAAVSA